MNEWKRGDGREESLGFSAGFQDSDHEGEGRNSRQDLILLESSKVASRPSQGLRVQDFGIQGFRREYHHKREGSDGRQDLIVLESSEEAAAAEAKRELHAPQVSHEPPERKPRGPLHLKGRGVYGVRSVVLICVARLGRARAGAPLRLLSPLPLNGGTLGCAMLEDGTERAAGFARAPSERGRGVPST